MAVITVVALASWIAILAGFDGDGLGIVGFVAGWTVMMVAMMLPSTMPLILLYRRGATPSATVRLVAGYLAVWGTVGIAAWVIHIVSVENIADMDNMAGMDNIAAVNIPAIVVLLAAGIYQLTPMKQACLRRCRTPADFLVERWRTNAFVLGADHGRYCLGCCWALMAVLVVAGMMGIIWVMAIATIVAVEKLSRPGARLARWIGIALIAFAILKTFA